MERRHATYPFLDAAREAVAELDPDLRALADEERVVARATERVERALTDGDIGEPHRDVRTELLSYPLARVLVSLVDEHILTRRYARSEAGAAHERFTAAEGSKLKSAREQPLTADDLLAEFDLARHVHPAESDLDDHLVEVGAYLPLAADMRGEGWRLVNRALADGMVPVSTAERDDLLRKAVERRVADGLPLAVPTAVGDALDGPVADLRETLADLDLTRDIDTVVPERFPPCMKALLDGVQKGDHLAHHSRFAITAFLASIGMTTDEIVDLYTVNPGFAEDITRYQTDHIRGETGPTEYSPPSCATMQSYGDCINKDERCETISHPLAYYEEALDDADEEELTDWREANEEADDEGEAEA
ncbi:DNA primase regulatory subunit PriL [Halococcus hamelinensis]|jgi:DNA primase large subunit|uniref:DNA primase large subunit PriL n=1 Tax=Halococcus hamelinensis 100A6 TaxID=1132509 RepID=M0M3W0_9EURY|nr:DNA primase regulatory subunit PriL [Halococcus hamelinensis]EMA39040.1 DNA primase large subunit [Halococcus hamelinensis 100A6]